MPDHVQVVLAAVALLQLRDRGQFVSDLEAIRHEPSAKVVGDLLVTG
jgi:hypothetical protein